MANPINIPPVGPRPIELHPGPPAAPKPPLPGGEAPSFRDVLTAAVTEVERLKDEADITIKQLVAGEIKDVTEAMIAVEKADLALQTMMTVRGKVMSAYEEIMRMQV